VDKSKRLSGDVAGLDEITDDQIPAAGKVWRIERFVGAGAYLDDTIVCLIWDADGTPDILDCTHGDATHDLDIRITGDGVKVLRLALQNDTNDAHIMAGSYVAKEQA
jgi:hypothetical protein